VKSNDSVIGSELQKHKIKDQVLFDQVKESKGRPSCSLVSFTALTITREHTEALGFKHDIQINCFSARMWYLHSF